MSIAEPEFSSLVQHYRSYGQDQVFAFADQLSDTEKEELAQQAAEIDLAEIADLKRTLIEGDPAALLDLTDLEPAPYELHPGSGGDFEAWARAEAAGEAALRAGRVAAFTVAGGQGTRLGFDGPKGTFPVTPVSRKSLFQVFAEKIAAAARRYNCAIPWLIMTSHQNHDATVAFFAEHGNFGLSADQVEFFRQGRMPAVDENGKIMLESVGRIALSPDGHGGSLRALHRSGALDRLSDRGIDTISYFQVDNPLVRCIDPAFIGWHLLRESEMSSKMVAKAYAAEKVGHFCRQRNKLVVVEYSDLPTEHQEEVDSTSGRLRYLAGSIALHILDREFVRRLARSASSGQVQSAGSDETAGEGGTALPFHRANKKIATIDGGGKAIEPTSPNGIKFEMFVFDALPFARNPVVIETLREDDFSPVKNAEGNDSPATSRRDQLRQFTRWANAAGAQVPVDNDGDPQVTFEVAPSFGVDASSFAESWRALNPKPAISDGIILQ